MRAALKEVEHLEKKAREDAGLPVDAEEGTELPPITLPRFKEMQKQMRSKLKEERDKEKQALDQKLSEIEAQMEEVQDRLKLLSREPEAYKENISRNGDSAKSRQSSGSTSITSAVAAVTAEEEQVEYDEMKGALGPDDEFVEFPEYNGSEPPKEAKKTFALFCNRNRKDVKASLEPEERTKEKVNGILKERFLALSDDEKQHWRSWAAWDKKRYARDVIIYEKSKSGLQHVEGAEEEAYVSKRRRQSEGDSMHVPKKKKKRPHE